MSERDEQIAVFDILALNESLDPRIKWIHASMNGVHSASPKTALDRKRQGQKAGISDICLPFPSFARCCVGAYIEMKVKPNKPTVAQSAFLTFVASHGYAVTIAYSVNEALDFIEDYLGMKLRGRK